MDEDADEDEDAYEVSSLPQDDGFTVGFPLTNVICISIELSVQDRFIKVHFQILETFKIRYNIMSVRTTSNAEARQRDVPKESLYR